MKIALISDTHWGLTKPKALNKMLLKLAQEPFDVLIHAGDYCGTRNGFKPTRATVQLIRDFFPEVPYLTVLGNHEYYTTGEKRRNSLNGNNFYRPSVETFKENFTNIKEMFEEYNVHFLDDKGLYIHEDYKDIIITGHTGWYKNPNPLTNDINYLPYNNEGNIHNYLYNKSIDELEINLQQLDHYYRPGHSTVVYVSHFPIIKDGTDGYKGAFELFCGDPNIAKVMQKDYACRYFLEGHSHLRKEGPLKYNCGSDYGNPKYLIMEIK